MIIFQGGVQCGGPEAPKASLAKAGELDLVIDGVAFVAGGFLRDNSKYVAIESGGLQRAVVAEVKDGQLWFVDTTDNWALLSKRA